MAPNRILLAARAMMVLAGLVALAFLASSLANVRLLYEATELLAEKPPQTAQAIENARNAGRFGPGEADEVTIAGAQAAAGRTRQAIATLRGSVATEPDNASAWVLLGKLLISSSHPEEGRRALQRAWQLNGRLPSTGAQP